MFIKFSLCSEVNASENSHFFAHTVSNQYTVLKVRIVSVQHLHRKHMFRKLFQCDLINSTRSAIKPIPHTSFRKSLIHNQILEFDAFPFQNHEDVASCYYYYYNSESFLSSSFAYCFLQLNHEKKTNKKI